MKKIILGISLIIFSLPGFAGAIPQEVSDDMLKSAAIDLLKDNIEGFYKITEFLGGRITDENGKEMGLGIVQFVNPEGECKKVVAVVRETTCKTVEDCTLSGYLLDCRSQKFQLE